jgi:hypothetical protein
MRPGLLRAARRVPAATRNAAGSRLDLASMTGLSAGAKARAADRGVALLPVASKESDSRRTQRPANRSSTRFTEAGDQSATGFCGSFVAIACRAVHSVSGRRPARAALHPLHAPAGGRHVGVSKDPTEEYSPDLGPPGRLEVIQRNARFLGCPEDRELAALTAAVITSRMQSPPAEGASTPTAGDPAWGLNERVLRVAHRARA